MCPHSRHRSHETLTRRMPAVRRWPYLILMM